MIAGKSTARREHGDNDSSLVSVVQDALRRTGYRELNNVTVTENNGLLLLGGRVSRYYLKQLAQTVALHTHRKVLNLIEVKPKSRHSVRSVGREGAHASWN
jgi:hypothetical protein